jgi:diguanylate cyclase (GGDEF)-like protein
MLGGGSDRSAQVNNGCCRWWGVERAPALSRLIDRGTAALSAVVLLGALVTSGASPPWPAWLALPLVVVASRAPLALPAGSREDLVIGLDSSLLVLLGLTLPWRQALIVWGVSISAAELTSKRAWDTRLFNAGVCVLAGTAGLAVLQSVPKAEAASPKGLIAAVGAAVVYFAVDYLWSAVSIAAVDRTPVRELIDRRGLPLALACFVGVDSLGFLAVVVVHQQLWAVALLVVPFVALLWASRSWSNMGAAERRGSALSAAGLAIQRADEPAQVERIVLEHAPLMLRAPGARWASSTDDVDGLSAPFAPGGQVLRRLHIPARSSGGKYGDRDVDALRMLLSVAEQAHDRLRLLAELGRSATTDSLTGLANRALFRDELTRALTSGERAGVLYCDLDGFKAVNDTCGHAGGDAVLVTAAGRLVDALRPGDLVARLGGDEFAVLLRELPAVGAPEVAKAAADRVCLALSAPYQLAGRLMSLSASVGIALPDGGDAEQLLHAGDAAMYAAKSSGGDRSQAYSPRLIRERSDRARVADELRGAVRAGQFAVYYQPIVGALDGGVLGVEALVRWQHPQRGLLAPAAFLSVAAEAGLLDDIGVFVLRTAVADVGAAARLAGRTLSLAVNANASQLVSGSLRAALQQLLPLDGVRLTIEVTEDELVDGAALDELRELRELGVRIALDDFGTGWSNLSLLRRLPVDTLKLDKSFVADLPDDTRAAALARAVIEMSRALGLGTVAEGVESAAQSASLRLMGCSMLQGDHFGRPQPVSSLAALIESAQAPV